MITFDFDETLTHPTWGRDYALLQPATLPNTVVLAALRTHLDNEKSVAVVSTRYRCDAIYQFIEEHQLPISQVHCTKGELKGDFLKSMNVTLYYDDSIVEARHNKTMGIDTMLVQYEYNQTAQRLICTLCSYDDLLVK